MDHMIPVNVLSAYSQIYLLKHDIREAIRYFDPRLNSFENFKNQFVVLHHCVWSTLTAIDGPVDYFLDLGLRISEESWRIPPLDATEAMEEVERIVNSLESLLNMGTREFPLRGYPLFEMGIHTQNDFHSIHEDSHDDLNMPAQLDPDLIQGATEEQINATPVHSATNTDTQQICGRRPH